MIHRTVSTWMRALPGPLALGAVALGAGAAPALADVIVDPNAPPATVIAPAAPTYSYTYTVTTPTTTYTTVAPAAPAETTTTTVTSGPAMTAPGAPPPPRTEVIPPAPAPQMVWQVGYWSYNGANWDWVPGHYQARPQPAAQWIPGHWAQQPGGAWVWIAGRWT